MKKIKLLFLITLLAAATGGSVNAQCTLAIGSTSSGSAGITATSLTISHNTASGSNRLLIVRASTNDADPTSVTYNAVSLTKKSTHHNGDQYVSIWYLIAPPVGTFNVVINGASGFTPIAGATSFTGADQTNPFGTAASASFNGSNPSVNVSSASGQIVIDVVNENSFQLTVGSGQTQQYNISQFVYWGSGSSEPGSGTVTMSWSGFSPTGAILAIPVKPCANLVASAGNAQTICSGASVTIGGNPTASGGAPPYTYSWSPSAGLSSTTVANPVASPTTTTTYTVTVTDNASGSATSSVTITVNPTPTANAGSNVTICSGTTTTIGGSPTASGGTAPYTYAWSPSAGLSSTTAANPAANPTATTTYTVTVTDSKGCSSSSNVTVTVNPSPTASAGSNKTICNGASTTIGGSPTASGGTSPYTYAWTPSTGLSSTTAPNPTANPTTTTEYTVTVTDSKGCTSTSTVSVTVNPNPAADAGSNQTICSGTSVTIGGSPTASGGTSPYTYAWTPSSGLSSTTVANPTASPTATTTYSVTVTDSKGCASSTSTVTVTVNPGPTANAGSNHTICTGASVTIGGSPTASGGIAPYTYAWSPAAGLSSTTVANPTATPTATTTYTVVVTDDKNCTSTSTVSVTVNPTPTASAGSNKTICDGANTTIGGSPTASGGTSPYTYSWTPSSGLSSTTVANPTASPTATTTYTVTVTDNKGCTSTSTVNVTVNPSPVADAGGQQTIFIGQSATIGNSPTASGGTPPYTYAWSPATALSSTTVANPVASPTVTTTYTVVVTDANGCTDQSSVTVMVNDPNANCGLQLGSTTAGFTSNTTVNTFSVSHTVPSGGNRLLVVRAATLNGDPTSVTYNGISLTKYATANVSGDDFVSIWYLINPPVGTFVVQVNGSTSFTPEIGVTNFIGADQTTPFGTAVNNTFTSATSSSVTVTSASDEIVIDVIRTFAEFTAASGQTTNFKLHGFVSWGAGSSKPGASSVTMTWTGSFTRGAQIGVSVKPAPPLVVNAGSNSTICSGSSTTVGGSPTASGGASPYTYSWSPSAGLSSTTVANPVASPTSTTNYVVSVTDANSCTKTASVTVTVNPTPTANAGADVTIFNGLSTTIGGSPTATGGTPPYTYAWSPAAGLNNTTSANPSASPSVTTTYTVVVTDANGCSGSDAIMVTIKPVPYYGSLTKKLDAEFYSAVDGFLFFKYDGEYNTGTLNYKIYDKVRFVHISNTLTPGALTPATKKYGDNRFAVDVSSLSLLGAGQFYTLEVTNEKNEVSKLKFRP